MQVLYTKSEYNEMVKELCLMERQLSNCIDVISNQYLYNDFNEQANATCEAKKILDRMISFVVQMNFITCNIAQSMLSKEETDGLFNTRRQDSDNTDNDSGDTGDNMELSQLEEGDKGILENSETELDEQGSE